MTTTRGQATGEGSPKGSRSRSKGVSQSERPFDPGERAASHHRTAKAPRAPRAGSGAKAGGGAGRRPATRGRQEPLPFAGPPSNLMARLRPERFTRRLIQLGVALLAILLAGALLMVIYHLSHGMRIFELREVVVRRVGTAEKLIQDSEIEQLVRKHVTTGVLRADLEAMRSELRRHEYIREAEVRRLLPDAVSVTITERVPYALARREDGSVQCVDQEGSLFGTASLFKIRPLPPLIRGLREVLPDQVNQPDQSTQDAGSFNRERLAGYQTLMADLDRIEPPLSVQIDEIYFDDVEGVRVLLADTQTAVFLGREDFRRRLNAALDILDAVKRKDLESLRLLRLGDAERLMSDRRIRYVNATNPNRIMIGFDD
jgi:cell division septal protein FtsQ